MVKGILRKAAALLLLTLALAGCAQSGRGSEAPALAASPTTAAQAAAGTSEIVTTDSGTTDSGTVESVTTDSAATGAATITLAPAGGYAGTFVAVSGAGWPASRLVVVKLADEQGLSSVLAAITTDAEGQFTTGFVYPVGDRWLRPGAETVFASTEDGDVTAMASYSVVPPEGVAAPTVVPTPTAAAATAMPSTQVTTATQVATSTQVATPAPAPTSAATITFNSGALASQPPYAAVEPVAGRANSTVTVSGDALPTPFTPTPPPPTPTGGAGEMGGVVCHRPPGNPNNAHTITVDPAAVAAHLSHGDTLGACPTQEGNPDALKQGKEEQEKKDKDKAKEEDKGKGNDNDKGKGKGKGKAKDQ